MLDQSDWDASPEMKSDPAITGQKWVTVVTNFDEYFLTICDNLENKSD